jgi:hypothetical protein
MAMILNGKSPPSDRVDTFARGKNRKIYRRMPRIDTGFQPNAKLESKPI